MKLYTNEIYDLFACAPKIDLHCHLDGSISINQVKKNFCLIGLEWSDEEIQSKVVAPKLCSDLTEYLSCFHYLTKSISNSTLVFLAVKDICQQAYSENIVYLELRFSPIHLSNKIFSIEETVISVIKSVEFFEHKYPIKIGIILCMMRGQSFENNQYILNLANKYRNKISGVDLAGNEKKYQTYKYINLLEKACSMNIPLTVHAGETGNVDDVYTAINAGAKRIGHGIAASKNQALCNLIREKGVTLELCPVCNIQTQACKSWEEYPFLKFYKDERIPITINTDNRTVSRTNLTNEFKNIHSNCMELEAEDIRQLTLNSLKASFLNDKDKERINKLINEWYKNFYGTII